jgi:hypothetical protein
MTQENRRRRYTQPSEYAQKVLQQQQQQNQARSVLATLMALGVIAFLIGLIILGNIWVWGTIF